MNGHVAMVAKEILMCGLRQVPVLGRAIDVVENVSRRHEMLRAQLQLKQMEEQLTGFERMMRDLVQGEIGSAIVGLSTTHLSVNDFDTHIRTLNEIKTNGWAPLLFQGLLERSEHWEGLKRNPGHYGTLLSDGSACDPDKLHVFIDADKTRVLELAPVALHLLLTRQKDGVVNPRIVSAGDVWALKGVGATALKPAPVQPVRPPQAAPAPRPVPAAPVAPAARIGGALKPVVHLASPAPIQQSAPVPKPMTPIPPSPQANAYRPPVKLPAPQMPGLMSKARRLADKPRSRGDQSRQSDMIEKSLDEFATGNIDEAFHLASEAIGIDARNSEAHTALGKILVRQEKLKEGIEQLELAVQLAPLDPAPLYALGFTLRAMERNIEAAEIYETFLRLMPKAIDAPKMRQWIMHVKGIAEADTSPRHENEGFVDDPIVTQTDKLYQWALDRFKTCSANMTIEDCERILSDAPDHARTRILLGRAYMRDGEFEKATEAFTQVLELCPDCAEALFFIGQSFEKSGDSPHALRAYRRYVEENPDGPRVEKLRAWFLAHGVADTGKGLSQQIQCEWCLRFFDEGEISLYESKTTCNGCLTLMGSTPIQYANKLETVDLSKDGARRWWRWWQR